MLYQRFSAIFFSLKRFCVIFVMTKIAFYNLEAAKLRALRVKNVLTCQHANVPWVLTCSRALRAYVSLVHVPYMLTFSRFNVP